MILGLGELLWDHLPDGRRVAGGAPFNFAFHCSQLGRDALIVSAVGDDPAGRDLREAVRALDLSDAGIATVEAPTGRVDVELDGRGVPRYAILQPSAWDFIPWTADLAAWLASAEALGVGTLAQRAGSHATIQRALAACPGLTLMDVNFRPPFDDLGAVRECLPQLQWLKATAEEWARVEPLAPGWSGGVAVTDGGAGARLRPPGSAEWQQVLGVAVEVVDTVGAGDAFTAALVCGTLDGWDWPRNLARANRYAAAVCTRPGGTPRLPPDTWAG